MYKVLFICVHNSARSQMAEAYLEKLGKGMFDVESAGMEPTRINPYVEEVMKEDGIDLSGKSTQSVFELFKQGKIYQYVITVCDDSVDNQCPIFPGITHRMHLPFADPAKARGTREEKLAQVREIRDKIKTMIEEFIASVEKGEEKNLMEKWGTGR